MRTLQRKKRSIYKTTGFAVAVFGMFFAVREFWSDSSGEAVLGTTSAAKKVILKDDGLEYETETSAPDVKSFLSDKKISTVDSDLVFPDPETPVMHGMNIGIKRARRINILDGNNSKPVISYASTISEMLAENNIELSEFDIVSPKRSELLPQKGDVSITRVIIERKIIPEPIAFEKIKNDDDSLSWRTKKITQKGENGVRETTYEIISHNGKEISRKAVDKRIAKEPVPEIAIQGTYMKLGKANTGWGTWYAQPKKMIYSYPQENGMTAASPWIGIGKYVKVTNKENGRSIVVRINDRGPFGKNRIIDLNTPAFQKIASLGAGVIDVKVEEILN